MEYLKTFENNIWYKLIEEFDIYHLMEIITYKYGKEIFKDLLEEINNIETDYNPDEFYELIFYELERHNLLTDFINNYKKYEIEHDELDPTHWRFKNKITKKLTSNWD